MQDVVAYCKIDNINECASSPCVNGDCEDGIDMFNCTCSEGFFGDFCQSKNTLDNFFLLPYFSYLTS